MKNKEDETRNPKPATHKIQWLNLPGYKGETWNPIIGCSKVSKGCENCYAEKMAVRLAHIATTSYYGAVTKQHSFAEPYEWNGKTHLIDPIVFKPLHWRKPRVVFVCSMGDLFHESTPFTWIDHVYKTMEHVEVFEKHIFIILTKRAERMLEYYEYRKANSMDYGHSWIWLGVTAENQEQANKRIPHLLQIKAPVRFVSIEPMLEPIDFYDVQNGSQFHNVLTGVLDITTSQSGILGDKLDWVITGGESGHSARPMHPDWVRSIRKQCKNAGVPFFFKQWGEWIPAISIPKEWGHPADIKGKHSWVNKSDGKSTGEGEGCMVIKVGKHRSGNSLDGEKYEAYPAIAVQS